MKKNEQQVVEQPQVVEIPKQTPKETPKSDEMKTDAEKERSSTLDEMFNNQTEVPTRKVQPSEEIDAQIDEALKKDAEKEEPKEKVEESKEEPKADDDLDILDIDFDAEPEAEVEKPEDTEIDEKGLDEKSRRSIATMRKQLQIAGRRAKDAESKAKELEVQIASKDAEIKKLQEEVSSPRNAAANPMKHPEVKSIQDSIVKDRDAFTMLMPSEQRAQFTKEFEGMLRDFADVQNAKNPDARDAMLNTLREKVEGAVDDNMVDRAMELLARNHGNYTDILAKIENFGELAEQQEVTESIKGWDNRSAKGVAAINKIANLDDEIIEANPHTPAAFVAKMVRDDPSYAKRSEQAKAAVIESFFGKRPLTPEEIDNIKQSEEVDGIKLADFMKERSKKEEKALAAAMQRQYLILMLGPKIPKMIQQSATANQQELAKKAERDALLQVTDPPKKKAERKEETPSRAQDRPSAVGSILEAM